MTIKGKNAIYPKETVYIPEPKHKLVVATSEVIGISKSQLFNESFTKYLASLPKDVMERIKNKASSI